MKYSKPLISVVIPAKNGGSTIGKCLNGLFNQSIKDQIEVIIIDSGSTDDTLEILKDYSIKLIQIEPTSFNHGATRNLGVQQANGEFIFMTVQDAWTDDLELLKRISSHFDDPEVMGVCGQQIVPHEEDKNPVAWFRPYSEPTSRMYQFEPSAFNALSPPEKSYIGGWDNVLSLYRRTFLEDNPFDITNFSEDIKWSCNTLQKGYKLVFDYRNRVYHYHHEGFNFRFKRQIIESYNRLRIFEYHPSTFRSFVKEARKITAIGVKHKIKRKWWKYNLVLLTASTLANTLVNLSYILGNQWLDSLYTKVSREIPQGNQG